MRKPEGGSWPAHLAINGQSQAPRSPPRAPSRARRGHFLVRRACMGVRLRKKQTYVDPPYLVYRDDDSDDDVYLERRSNASYACHYQNAARYSPCLRFLGPMVNERPTCLRPLFDLGFPPHSPEDISWRACAIAVDCW